MEIIRFKTSTGSVQYLVIVIVIVIGGFHERSPIRLADSWGSPGVCTLNTKLIYLRQYKNTVLYTCWIPEEQTDLRPGGIHQQDQTKMSPEYSLKSTKKYSNKDYRFYRTGGNVPNPHPRDRPRR